MEVRNWGYQGLSLPRWAQRMLDAHGRAPEPWKHYTRTQLWYDCQLQEP